MNTLSIQKQATTSSQTTKKEKKITQKYQPLIAICCLSFFPLIYLIGKFISGLM